MKYEYALGTETVIEDHPMACGFKAAKALCPDGTVRALRFKSGGIADTYWTVPASVQYKQCTVTGYMTIQTVQGFTCPDDNDPMVVKFFPTGKYKGIFDSF